eukprot:4054442-Pleurochrysis_carterae.AAC.1
MAKWGQLTGHPPPSAFFYAGILSSTKPGPVDGLYAGIVTTITRCTLDGGAEARGVANEPRQNWI